MKRRVVVTGLGIISPVGNDQFSAWNNIINGYSGISKISRFDASNINSQIAGEVKNFEINSYISLKESRQMDTFMCYGIAAATQALKDSGIEINDQNSNRIGIIIGSGIGGLPKIEETQNNFLKKGFNRISPFFVTSSLINLIPGYISIKYRIKGPSYSVVSACATGLHCIGDAGRLIEYGDVDIMLAGSSESTISHLGIGGFAAMRALSTRNEDPLTASRPWDKDRDGFVIGEGSGVLVLEEYHHAKKRGAKIYCELLGYGMSSDAYHITAPNIEGPVLSMINAMKNAKINADQINYINAHGTSTKIGDQNETDAIKIVFGNYAYDLVLSSTKSMTGHLLGAAGGIEAVFLALSIFNQVAPPTINIFHQDLNCDLDYCANEARSMNIQIGASNSFGFGGTNGTIIFSKI